MDILKEFEEWFYSVEYRKKYTKDSPAYLAANEAWLEKERRYTVFPRISEKEFLEKYGHESYCNLMFISTINTDEDYCDCITSRSKPNGC